MGNDQVGTERRKEQRYQVNEQAIAVLKIGSRFTRLGRIVDVSRSGLAFDYLLLDGAAAQKAASDDEVGGIYLNILTEDGFMVLSDVAVQPVNDRLLQREERFYAAVPTRRCGVRFDHLTNGQREQIGKFLLRRSVLND